MSTTEKDLVGSIEEAIGDLEQQREEISAREALLRNTLEALRGSNGNSNNNGHSTKSAPERLSVSDEKLEKVAKYLREHPRSKQTDLAKRLGFNSGTVSVALRILEKDGKARRVESDEPSNKPGRRSQVWDVPSSQRGRSKKVPA